MLALTHCVSRKLWQSAAPGLLVCGALVALALPIRADAQFTGSASATTQFESNSNVFDLESDSAIPAGNGFRRSDTDYAYGAEFDGKYMLGRQQIYATASTTQYDYQHITELSHNEYKLGAGLNWKLGELLDGKLDVARTHSMVPFLNLIGSDFALSVATAQTELAQIGLKVSPDWKVEGSASTSKTDEPIPGTPNLQLTLSSGTASIEYLGLGALTSGFTVGYMSGEYSGSSTSLTPSYHQETAGLLADYKHNSVTFEGQIGYSHSASATGDEKTAGFTGLLELEKQLTPKTRLTVKIDRAINSYIAIASQEFDTDAGVGIDWQATSKLGVSLGYTFTYRAFPEQAINGSYQVDYQEYATMAAIYQPRPWLLIRPYANLQTRRSNFNGLDFNSTIFGVSITATAPGRPR